METFVRMDIEYSKEYVNIPDSGRKNVEKKSRQKHVDSNDSTTEESIEHTEAYHSESGEQVEASEETALKAVPIVVKRKRIGSPIIHAKRAGPNKSTERAQSKQSTPSRMEKEAVVSIFFTAEWTVTPRQFKKGIRSKRTRKTASKAFEI